MGAAGEVLDELGDGFGVNLECPGSALLQKLWKTVICVIRCLSRAESILLQVLAPSWTHLGRKVEPDRSKIASAWQVRGVRTIKFGRSVRSCCKGYGNDRKSAQPQVKSKAKVYLSDKTYD